jgi:predicted MFS family arabinose efflux permease
MKKTAKDLRLLAIGVFCTMLGFGAFNAAYNNFIVDKLNLNAWQLGRVEGIRETPGFIIVFVAALTMRIAEPVVAAAALMLFGIGMAAYYGVNGISSLIMWSVIWSVGFHAWMTLQPSMTLNLADEGSKGKLMGLLAAVSALGTLLGLGLVAAIGRQIGFRMIFLFSGVTVFLGALAILLISKDIGHAAKPRLVFKPKYSLYYALTFLEGCRKQIFNTFAIFLLVRNFHTNIVIVSILMIANNIANMLFSPWIGRMIDKFGERRVLMVSYATAIPVFLGYATVGLPILCYYIFYFLDNFFYIGSMGSSTYIQKVAEPQDLQPSLAMGVSCNHAAAVAVPLIGGLLWARYGYAVAFYGGAIAAALSVLAVSRMKVGVRIPETIEEPIPLPAE